MTDLQVEKLRLQTKIDLYHFSLSNTTHPIHRIQLNRAIAHLQSILDNMGA